MIEPTIEYWMNQLNHSLVQTLLKGISNTYKNFCTRNSTSDYNAFEIHVHYISSNHPNSLQGNYSAVFLK